MYTVDVQEFQEGAVTLFLESIYGGNIHFSQPLFRDLHKLAVVFGVEWVSVQCGKFLCGLIEGSAGQLETLVFCFEEAIFAETSIDTPNELLSVVKNELMSLDDRIPQFIEPYLGGSPQIMSVGLNSLVEIAGTYHLVFLDYIKKEITQSGLHLTFSAKYLLERVDLVGCMEDDVELFEEVFDTLLEKVVDLSMEDMRAITKLYKDASKRFRERVMRQVSSDSTQSVHEKIRAILETN